MRRYFHTNEVDPGKTIMDDGVPRVVSSWRVSDTGYRPVSFGYRYSYITIQFRDGHNLHATLMEKL